MPHMPGLRPPRAWAAPLRTHRRPTCMSTSLTPGITHVRRRNKAQQVVSEPWSACGAWNPLPCESLRGAPEWEAPEGAYVSPRVKGRAPTARSLPTRQAEGPEPYGGAREMPQGGQQGAHEVGRNPERGWSKRGTDTPDNSQEERLGSLPRVEEPRAGAAISRRVNGGVHKRTPKRPQGRWNRKGGLEAEPSREMLLRFVGRVNDRPTRILLDCGANRNYVSREFLDRHRIPWKCEESQYRTAGGDMRRVMGHSGPVRLQLSGHRSRPNLLVISEPEYDVILGTPWLFDHNPRINWRDKKVTIREPGGETIELRSDALSDQDGGERVVHPRARAALMTRGEADTALRRATTPCFLATLREVETSPPQPACPRAPQVDKSTQERLAALKESFQDVFPADLPAG